MTAAMQTETRFIETKTLQAGHVAEALRRRPLATVALALVAVEAVIALAGGRFPALSALVLVAAPGLALAALLPAETRTRPVATLAAVPALGICASVVALVSVAAVGVPLTGTSVRVVIACLVLVGFALPGYEPPRPFGSRLEAAGLGLGLVLAAVLQQRVVGDLPIPGNDWAKYVLYADEVRIHHSLLIDNPYWMLGVPFREEPGVPALYGSFLGLTGQPAAVVAQGIWVFALAQVTSVFAFVRSFWGPLAAAAAAVLYAALPLNLTMLGWHGLANAAALAIMPLLLLYATALARGSLGRREAVGCGLVLVGIAASHRLTTIVAAAAGAAVVAAIVLLGQRPRRLVRPLLWVAAATLALAPAVVYDLWTRNESFGGTLGYRSYLPTKLDFELLARDLSLPFAALSLVAVVLAVRWAVRRRDRTLAPLLGTLAVVMALTLAWVVHLPLVYLRMAYFFPLVLVPLVVVAVTRSLRPRVAAAVLAVVALLAAATSWDRTANIRDFYGFANPTSLRGLDAVAADLRPNEVVVTDRCWSFLSTWLLHTPTLPALETIDIQPKAELARARQAKAVLADTPEGREIARRLDIRFLLVDPSCSDAEGHAARPPAAGQPVFLSSRLAVLRLPRR
jgi:hypothetical protein